MTPRVGLSGLLNRTLAMLWAGNEYHGISPTRVQLTKWQHAAFDCCTACCCDTCFQLDVCRQDAATPVSPVPVRQRGDPAFYSQERKVPQPMQPMPGGQPGSPQPAMPQPAMPLQPSVGFRIQQGAGILIADLPSSQQQADSLKASACTVFYAKALYR